MSSRSAPRRVASRTGSIPPIIAARRTSASSSRASTRRVSVTTRTASRRTTRRSSAARVAPAVPWPTTSAMALAIRTKDVLPRRLRTATRLVPRGLRQQAGAVVRVPARRDGRRRSEVVVAPEPLARRAVSAATRSLALVFGASAGCVQLAARRATRRDLGAIDERTRGARACRDAGVRWRARHAGRRRVHARQCSDRRATHALRTAGARRHRADARRAGAAASRARRRALRDRSRSRRSPLSVARHSCVPLDAAR